MKTARGLIMLTAMLASLTAPAVAHATEPAVVASVQKLLDAENQTRAKLDGLLIDALKEMQNTSATQNTGDILDAALDRAETKVTDMKAQLAENHLRIEFLNSFISALEQAGDARGDSGRILLDMAHKEMLASVETGNETKLWTFELYLSIAIRDIMEPSENFADFIKKFMAYSSLRDPRSPAGFMKDRKYIEGPSKRRSKSDAEIKESLASAPDRDADSK